MSDRAVKVANGRYLADHLPDAEYLELPGDDHFPWEGNADRVTEARQDAGWLMEKLEGLPLIQKEIILLSCVKEIELGGIARMLKLPLGTVKTHLRRARIKLVDQLTLRESSMKKEAL